MIDRPIQSATSVSDSNSVSDDPPGKLTQSSWRGTKRTQAKPESADSLTAVNHQQIQAAKKMKMAKFVGMHIDRLSPKLIADMLKCWSFFPSPHHRKGAGRIFEKNQCCQTF